MRADGRVGDSRTNTLLGSDLVCGKESGEGKGKVVRTHHRLPLTTNLSFLSSSLSSPPFSFHPFPSPRLQRQQDQLGSLLYQLDFPLQHLLVVEVNRCDRSGGGGLSLGGLRMYSTTYCYRIRDRRVAGPGRKLTI